MHLLGVVTDDDGHIVVGDCVHDGVGVSVDAVEVFILNVDLREGFERNVEISLEFVQDWFVRVGVKDLRLS